MTSNITRPIEPLRIGKLVIHFKRERHNDQILFVPKGIVRFSDGPGRSGWYCRLQREGRVLINQKIYDLGRNPQLSLDEAQKRFVQSIKDLPQPSATFARPRIKKTFATAMQGVCLRWLSVVKKGGVSPTHCIYVIVNYRPGQMGTKFKQKAFFLGTSNTLSKPRFEKNLRLAYAYRQRFNDLCLSGEEHKLKDGWPAEIEMLNSIKNKRFERMNYEAVVKRFLNSVQ